MAAEEKLNLTQKWDKVFSKSNKVEHQKVTFHNRYGITLAADLYMPKNASGKLSAIAVCGPFGAVKEQSSGLYAQQLAERGYLTIAFDPSFTGESGGLPRNVASPDINTEDFSAAVDTRIKATVTSTMYDLTHVAANGYFDAMDAEARYKLHEELNAQRTEDYRAGVYAKAGGVVDPLPEDAPQFVKDYHTYYKTPRGYHARSVNSTNGWNKTSLLSLMNMPILQYSGEIKSAVLMIHGDAAHSVYFSKDAFKKLKGENKELLLIPDAVHIDLYDNLAVIPFDKIDSFYQTYLK
ncbi:alpha/beta hydrolase [Selenomonas sp. TAMA-11512]|uniref:alpha/beta hydrolase n=1 Tax=Selenomonas sp. TAMA-11512 TaxID=3095337 RepID=UPI00308D69D3|nr:alpha/beta hydrolase [Selenomonas sp. TAMA-11512]